MILAKQKASQFAGKLRFVSSLCLSDAESVLAWETELRIVALLSFRAMRGLVLANSCCLLFRNCIRVCEAQHFVQVFAANDIRLMISQSPGIDRRHVGENAGFERLVDGAL